MRLYPINPENPVFPDFGGAAVARAVRDDSPASPPRAADLTVSSFKSERLTGKLMVDLGFGMMSAKSDSEFAFYLLSFSFVDPKLRLEGGRAVQYGTTMRLGISARKTKNTASLNLAGLSASATVEARNTSVQPKFHGMELSLSTRLGDQIPVGAPFDATMTFQIGKMTAMFQEAVRNDPSKINPDRLAATDLLSGAGANYNRGVSAAYALHRMTKGDDLQAALNRLAERVAKGNHDYLYSAVAPWVVASVYCQINGDDLSAPLSKTSKKAAQAIYDNTKGK